MGRVVQLTFGGVAFLTFVGAIVYLARDVDETTASSSSLAELCEDGSRTRIPDAPPYQGAGPHPILVYGPGVPALDDRKSPAAVWGPKPVDAQLVGCVGADSTPESVIGTCHFDFPEARDLQMRAMTTRLTVYEVRSRRKIAELTVHGTQCPTSVMLPADQDWVTGVPVAAEIREVLRKYVAG